MNLKFIASTLFTFFLVIHSILAFDKAEGWEKSGRNAKSYEMGLDKQAGRDGNICGSIQSIDSLILGNGSFIQKFNADHYQGKKINFSGFMKSKDVSEEASFLIRVDKTDSTAFLDNMYGREIKGNTDWNLYEITIEIPDNARFISIGASLKGIGQIWFDDLSFEIINNSKSMSSGLNMGPVNLDFEKIVD